MKFTMPRGVFPGVGKPLPIRRCMLAALDPPLLLRLPRGRTAVVAAKGVGVERFAPLLALFRGNSGTMLLHRVPALLLLSGGMLQLIFRRVPALLLLRGGVFKMLLCRFTALAIIRAVIAAIVIPLGYLV